MRACDGKHLCQEAQGYLYDLLGPDETAVPASVRHHVQACPACQERMRRLRDALLEAQTDPSPAESSDEKTIETLTEQFQLLDEDATCTRIKPLLPGLLGASPQIRIPTPVTVHVDHCPSCAQDLAALGGLDLTANQLKRLGRLFEPSRHPDPVACRTARATVAALGSLSFEGADVDTLNHVSMCPQCRTEVYQRRERLSGAVREDDRSREAVSCRNVSTTDVFDYVVPFGLTPAEASPLGGEQKAAVSHVRACPACMEKVQSLHRTIYDILERANSEITTVYHVEDGAAGGRGETQDALSRYPVSVQIVHSEPVCAMDQSDSSAAQAIRRRGPGGSKRSFGRMAVTVIAGIALALLPLWTNTPTASGTSVGDMLKALEGAENVCVTATWRGSDRPSQELLIARRLGLLVVSDSRGCVLYDLGHDCMRTIDPETGISDRVGLSRFERDRARQFMTNCLADVLARTSPDTKLQALRNDATNDLDVYEVPLSPGPNQGSPVFRAFLDPKTGRPHKTEYYRSRPREDPLKPETTKVFTYLTEPEMGNRIQAMFPAK